MADPAYLQKGLSLLQQATLLDSQGQISQAISHYLLGLEVLVKVHGYEKIDANKALLKGKVRGIFFFFGGVHYVLFFPLLSFPPD